MSNYNLSDNVNETFSFEVAGHAYEMRYPTMEEIEKMQVMITEIQEKVEDGQTGDERAVLEWLYKYVKPVKEDSPNISEVMKKQNLRVTRNFYTMIKSEFGLE